MTLVWASKFFLQYPKKGKGDSVMTHRFCLAALSAVLLSLSVPRLNAQAVYGSIVGTIADSSGAAVPKAKVTITDTGRDVTVSSVANESGNFCSGI